VGSFHCLLSSETLPQIGDDLVQMANNIQIPNNKNDLITEKLIWL